MTKTSRLLFALPLVLAAQTALAGAPSDSDACNSHIVEAAVKRVHVPNRWTGTLSAPGTRSTPILVISVGGKQYSQRPDGQWAVETWDPAKEEADLRTKGSAHTTCEPGGTDTIDGEAADVLVQHYASSGDTGTIRTWISQATGMTLRSEAHFTVRGAKTDLLSNYAYKDIQVPPGVK
jgi:hypothetical protein